MTNYECKSIDWLLCGHLYIAVYCVDTCVLWLFGNSVDTCFCKVNSKIIHWATQYPIQYLNSSGGGGIYLYSGNVIFKYHTFSLPGLAAQLLTCLATDVCLTADPGITSVIPARSHSFIEMDNEIISMVILPPSAESFKKSCCQLQANLSMCKKY